MEHVESERRPAAVSPVMIDVLREVAADEARWQAAMRDPFAVLGEHGLLLPAGTTLELYEAAWNPAQTTFRAPSGDVISTGEPEFRPYTGPCPPGMLPVRRLQRVDVCVKWGYVFGPPEWVPVSENSPYGKWVRPAEKVCLQSVREFVWVERCEFPELTPA